jgi:hypothetical protein
MATRAQRFRSAVLAVAVLGIPASWASPALAEESAGPPQGQYFDIKWTASNEEPARVAGLPAFAFAVQGGAIWIDSGCWAYGQGSYTAEANGSWHFDVGTMSTKGCLDRVATRVREAIGGLTQATAWSSVPSGSNSAEVTWVGPAGTLSATVYWTGEPPVYAPPASDPAVMEALVGSWRIERVEGVAAWSGKSGPKAWIVSIGERTVSFGPGCNTGAGSDYLTSPTGDWTYGYGGEITTKMGCVGDARMEKDEFHSLLQRATHWEVGLPDTVVLTAQNTAIRIVLARAAPTNLAFEVTALRAATTTVYVARGQTATLRIQASPLAADAVGMAPVAWKTNRKAVVRVAHSKAKSGQLSVPLGQGKGAKLTVTGVKTGRAAIVLRAASGVVRTIRVVVVSARVRPTNVRVALPRSPASVSVATVPSDDGVAALTLPWRASVRLAAKVRPSGATGAVPVWSSSDPKVARVDGTGTVTGVGPGEAVIVAKVGSLKARQTVRVVYS